MATRPSKSVRLSKPASSPKRGSTSKAGSTPTVPHVQGDKAAIMGRITGLYGDVLQGWAIDLASPEASLAVEVYYDGVYGHLVRADEIAINPSTPQAAFHGFVVSLKREWLSVSRRISARIANQGPWLEGAVELDSGKYESAPPYAASRLYHNDGLKLSGWVTPSDSGARPSVVQVLQDGAVVAKATANQRLAFLRNHPHQGFGFEIDLPWEFADGCRHTLEVVTTDGQPLAGSPVTVCATAGSYAKMVQEAWSVASPHAQTEQLPNAIIEVLRAHERLYPATVGFSHYAQWLTLFQAAPPEVMNAGRCTVLVVGEKSEQALIQVSVTSVQAQRLNKRNIECLVVRPSTVVDALRQLSVTTNMVVPLLAGDSLAPHALDMMSAQPAVTAQPGWGYTDSDTLDTAGNRTHPFLKPDWDETLFFGTDLISQGVFLSTAIVKEVFARADAKGERIVSWHDFLARVVATDREPTHLPWVLYHQQASVGERRNLSHKSRLSALNWLAQKRVPGAQVIWEDKEAGRARVVWPVPQSLPKVSVIVPTRDGFELLQAVMHGLKHTTSYPNLELIVVDNESTCPKTLELFKSLKKMGVRLVSYPKPFNYAAINNLAAKKASGELLLFLNNDTEMLEPDWLTEMVVQFQRPSIGIVGKKLLWPNRMVQHGGVVVGINGLAAHAFVQCEASDPGYFGFNLLDREQSAVTGACLMIRRADFLKIGGFDEISFPVAFNDVDLCLKIRQQNQRVVMTTRHPVIHNESASRGKEDSPQKRARARRERSNFMMRWMPTDCAFHDPYYHPGLNRDYHFGPYAGLGMLSFSNTSAELSTQSRDNTHPHVTAA